MEPGVCVELRERGRKHEADFDAACSLEAAMAGEILSEGEGSVQIRIAKAEIRRRSEARSSNCVPTGRGFGFRISGFIRASDFGFWIFHPVRQLHHIVEVILVAADLKDVDQTLMGAGDRLEFLDALE